MNNNCKEIRVLTEILQVKDLTITEKSTSTLIQAESIEKFQNGTEDIYIDEEYDEMEF